MRRRTFLALPALLALRAHAQDTPYPQVVRGRELAFPRDHGAHPAHRTEWWYITGWLGDDTGFQVTFFRNRPRIAEGGASRFAPTQLLFAHAALADAKAGRLLHDQRAARAGFGLAQAGEGDTSVHIDDWSLVRSDPGYRARVVGRELDLDLEFRPTQPLLLEGERGFSAKGPQPRQASYYYSWPQLGVAGTVRGTAVQGRAWLDHEWSSEALAGEAAGWDWTGVNGEDGSALMAFRIRAKDGSVYWSGGSFRSPDGRVTLLGPQEVAFEPLERWRSPRTGAEYPVAMRLRAGGRTFDLSPLMRDQELDARPSTGTVYWEGACFAHEGGRPFGRGYLELTGYSKPLKL